MTTVDAGFDYGAELEEAIRLFEAGAYWETHEVLERAWLRQQRGIERHFLAGVIQLAAALHKRNQGYPVAARRIYARAVTHLAWVPDCWRGFDLRRFELICLEALGRPQERPRIPFAGPKEGESHQRHA